MNTKIVGESVKNTLSKNNLTSVWLLGILEKKGILLEKSTLSAILNGRSKDKKAEEVLTTSKEILSDYEDWVRRYSNG